MVTGVDNEQALAAFENTRASTSSDRLRAARFLAQNATNAHRSRLSKIRETERNSWVCQALDQALKRLGMGKSAASTVALMEEGEAPSLDTPFYEELRGQAIEETSAFFLHELRPLVGFLEGAAATEIEHYACSKTKTSIGRVQSFLEAADRLRKASTAPALQEFDLTDLVVSVAISEATQGRATLPDLQEEAHEANGEAFQDNDAELVPEQPVAKLSLARRDPVITTGDPTMVEMAVANALRNAIESVFEVGEANRAEVIINWGLTDTDSWIAVLDRGRGLPMGWERLTQPGVSTKSKSQGHLGMGLPIAQRAIESMRGTVQLTPRDGGGASCEIRWPRGGKW